jgi:hypothetical protein
MYIEKMMEDWKHELYGEMDLQPAIDEIGTRKLLDLLLDNTGNKESYIRENVLTALYTIAFVKPVLSFDEYIHMLNISISETHLFNGIDGKDDDAAICRGFSSFGVAYAVCADAKHGFLSDAQFISVFDKATQYMISEKDRRGFIYGGKGIVHTIPHGAYLIKALIEHPKFSDEHAGRVLDCIKSNIVGKGRFAADDWADMRIAGLISSLLIKGITDDIIKQWIETLLPNIPVGVGRYTDEHYPYIQMGSDIQHFLMYVYYDLKKKSIHEGFREWIFEYSIEQGRLWNKVYLH